MVVSVKWIENHYHLFNKLYFGNTLPNIKFKANNSKTGWGYAGFNYDLKNDTIIPDFISISNYYDSPEKVKIQTLLHEMIHIADYTWHPEHYIQNGKRISGHSYNAHGEWFMREAERISKESGYKVTNHVTQKEVKSSALSNKTKAKNLEKIDNALMCAVFGTKGIWYFKTDVNKVKYLKKHLRKAYDWSLSIGEFQEIKFYKFDNKNFALRRSCCTNVRGWKVKEKQFNKILLNFKAKEINL